MVTRHQRHVCRLAQVGLAVYRTDLNGDVTVTTDGTTCDVKTGQASSQPEYWSVAAKTVITPQAMSTQSSAGAVCDCSYNRYNCKDYSGHDATQAGYEYCIALGKGDIHQLDGDKNGIACEGYIWKYNLQLSFFITATFLPSFPSRKGIMENP